MCLLYLKVFFMKSLAIIALGLGILGSFNVYAVSPTDKARIAVCLGKAEGEKCAYSPCDNKNGVQCMVVVLGVCVKGICDAAVE
jgi:hypothetical protein